VFVTTSHFYPSLIFAVNVSQVPSSDKALDYYSAVLITVSESFIALAIEYLDPVQNGVE